MLHDDTVGSVFQPHIGSKIFAVEVDGCLSLCRATACKAERNVVSHLSIVHHTCYVEVAQLGEQVVANILVEGKGNVISRTEDAVARSRSSDNLWTAHVACHHNLLTLACHLLTITHTYA